jgi:hypothetical protein
VAVRLGDFIVGMDRPEARRTHDRARDADARADSISIPPPFIFHAFPVKHPGPPAGAAPQSSAATMLQFALRLPAEHLAAAGAAEREAAGMHAAGQHRKAAALYQRCAHIAELAAAAAAAEPHPALVEQRARCHAARATSLVALEQADLALAEAEVAVRLHPSSHGLIARCSAYLLLSQLAEAERDCTAALERVHSEEPADGAHRWQLEQLLARVAAGRASRPLEALGALVAGENAALPWFLRADALAALAAAGSADDRDVLVPPPPPPALRIKEAVRQFILGGRGGGAPAHPHSHAVNALAYGMKRWRMWAPEHSHFSATSPWYGWRGGEGAGEFVECTQRGGDIMYVPASWGHSVLNLRDSVGQTTEFEVQLDGEEL